MTQPKEQSLKTAEDERTGRADTLPQMKPIIASRAVLALTITLFLSGCVLPVSDLTVSSMVDVLAKDPASACLRVGAVLYGEVLACRTNEPGSTILVKENGDLSILHGIYKIPEEERELKELRARVKQYEEWPKAWLLPPGVPLHEGM